MLQTISAYDARTKLGELLNLVYYKGAEVVIERKGKPMVRMIKVLTDSPDFTAFRQAAGSWKGNVREAIEKVYKARRDGSAQKKFLAKWS